MVNVLKRIGIAGFSSLSHCKRSSEIKLLINASLYEDCYYDKDHFCRQRIIIMTF